jgi:Calcineurin-like phosphoesterase
MRRQTSVHHVPRRALATLKPYYPVEFTNRKYRLQYMSDLHLEKHNYEVDLVPKAPNLALLGDIGSPNSQRYRNFIHTCSRRYDKVYLLAGNHEYYDSTIRQTQCDIKAVCQSAPYNNVSLLQNQIIEADNNIFLAGCTLWSNIKPETSRALNDFVKIKSSYQRETNSLFTVDEYLALHRRDVSWLSNLIPRMPGPLIVMTHHLPSLKMISSRYRPTYSDAFATSLEHLFQPPLIAWLCGHTHDNVERMINNVYCGVNSSRYIDFNRVLEVKY